MSRLNHLADEKSPYLLQHVHNPVDWRPWNDKAFRKAREEDKPIFLSIGYATCHWCHVMAHESFEDKEVAQALNRDYISIKVDREERPDVDKIYMAVCQALTGQGGWPLTIIMTPDAKPFFAATYLPKTGRMGMSGLLDVLDKLATLWKEDRGRILKAGETVHNAIEAKKEGPAAAGDMTLHTLETGYNQCEKSYDPQWGGFGNAPKFPTPHNKTFLLRWHKRNPGSRAAMMVENTLDHMRQGGIFDQIGFGFHRYSVDREWLVPHFEKMLYDQALLALAYIDAFQATGKKKFEQVAKEIFTYVLRDMTDPGGGFYSAEDADSEGEEGLFYVWRPEEIRKHLGDEAGALFCRFYDITEKGNFENGRSIAHIPVPLADFARKENLEPEALASRLEDAREKLFQHREKRIHPLKDDKILTAWNGLMIAAFAKGYQAFGDSAYANAAAEAAAFILKYLKRPDGRLLCRYRQGEAAYPAYLDDYAFLVWGLMELYEATFDISWLEEALSLNRDMLDIFWDQENGGLFFTGKGNEELLTRSKEIYDGATPSGNSVAALNLLRLGRMTGNVELERKAEALIQSFSAEIAAYPMGYTQMLHAIDFMIGPTKEIVITGDPKEKTTKEMIRTVQQTYLPNKVMLVYSDGREKEPTQKLAPFLKEMKPVDNKPTAYVCEQYACQTPITSLEELQDALKG